MGTFLRLDMLNFSLEVLSILNGQLKGRQIFTNILWMAYWEHWNLTFLFLWKKKSSHVFYEVTWPKFLIIWKIKRILMYQIQNWDFRHTQNNHFFSMLLLLYFRSILPSIFIAGTLVPWFSPFYLATWFHHSSLESPHLHSLTQTRKRDSNTMKFSFTIV